MKTSNGNEYVEERLITSVEKQKRNAKRYNIFINEQFAFSVHEDMLIKYRLLKGEYINAEQMSSIIIDEERHQVYLESIRYIGRRPRSKKEIIKHLKQKGYDEGVVSITIQRLEEQNYINDELFAKMWTEHRIFSQKKGRRWVQEELAHKGINKDHISGAIAEIGEEAEFENAFALAAQKWRNIQGESYDRKRKLAAFLLRRGFSNTIVNQVLRKVTNESMEELEFE